MSQQMLGMNEYSSWMNSKNTVLSCESEFTKPFNANALESMCDKHQIAEEPYNGKLLRAVLKSRGEGRPLSLDNNETPWRKLEKSSFKLQKRIYRASKCNDIKKMHKLQRLLLKSTSARMLAVRRV